MTDRNRTSPFAFTGNKFEFRAVGAKQSPSFPVCLLNASVAASITEMTEALIVQKGAKPEPNIDDILTVVRKYIKVSKPVRFEGNNYSQEWVVEAAKRGLPNIKTAPEAFKQLLVPANARLLTSQGIFQEIELKSRYHIMVETYVKNQLIEANTMKTMATQMVLPAAFAYRKDLASCLTSLKSLGLAVDKSPEFKVLQQLETVTLNLQASISELEAGIHRVEAASSEGDADKEAEMASTDLVQCMNNVRAFGDEIEEITADSLWPFPKYLDLLF